MRSRSASLDRLKVKVTLEGVTGLHRVANSASDSRARGSRFVSSTADSRRQLSVSSESMCMKYWLTA